MQKISRSEFISRIFRYSALSSIGMIPLRLLSHPRPAHAKTKPTVPFKPSYLKLHQSGELRRRGRKLWEEMKKCNLCPRKSEVNRFEEELGTCRASSKLIISSHHPHFGEERPLVGEHGSGTIFFANCGLRCVFCINWEISHKAEGRPRSISELAQMMLHLQSRGCHNINFVTPSHYLPHILLAVDKAAAKGLRLPLVYNTCGYERLEILRYLDGVVDIYLPDFKYSSGEMAEKYSADAMDYPEVAQQALLEMHRQVGLAIPAEDGVMRRGLMIRHLVMPNGVSGTKEVVQWIAAHLPKNTYVNLMSQYRPCYKAFKYPEISRRITVKEYRNAVRWAKEAGLTNVEYQGMFSWFLG